MRLEVILRYVAVSLLLNAAFLLVSGLVSLFYLDSALFPLVYSCLVVALFGLFPLIFIPPRADLTPQEGLAIVVYSWIVSCLVGILPYCLWGGEFNITNAWFESVSGYTTTGSTILTDVESLPPGLLFWRSATHFIGGIGIVVLVLAILPSMRRSDTLLYRMEASPWATRDFRTSTRRSILILFGIYLGLTLSESVALLFCGTGLFDAVTTAFGTVATGGFSPRQASIAAYNSLAVEITVMVFMVLSGIHFGLLFAAARGEIRRLLGSSVVRYYVSVLALACVLTTVSVHQDSYEGLGASIRYATFQVISIGTSTGFATADSSLWPSLSRLVLVLLTLHCACAGSTSGGIKADRFLVAWKTMLRRVREARHPRAVFAIKLGEVALEERVVVTSLAYVVLYLLVVFVSSCLLASVGVDATSAFTGSAATMGNVGPGLGTVGSVGSYAAIPAAGKWVLSLTMLLGRLEIYGLVVCLTPAIWRSASW